MRIGKRIIYLILPLLLLKSGLSAVNPEATIEEGLKDIYNVRLDDAENKFRLYQSQYPDDVKGFFYESMIYFYKSGSTKDEKIYNKYLELTDKVIDKCEFLLDKNDENVDALYYKGATQSYRSLLMLMLNKSLLKAADNGNDGYRILKKIVTNYPEYYDAYMGLGLFKIAIGFVPEKFKWLLSLIGIEGDLKDGIKMLKIAADKAKYNRIDSRLFFAIFSIREKEEQNTESLEIIRNLTEEYPESPAFRMLYGAFLVQICKMDEAIKQLNNGLNLNTNSLQKEMKKAIYSLLGTAYFRKNDFKNAVVNIDESFKYIIDEDRYNLTMFLLAVSYEMLGRRDIALEKYKASRNKYIEERDGEPEKLFYRYSSEKINTPINELDSLTIIAINQREEGLYNESLNTFNNIVNNKLLEKYNNDDANIRYYYELGILYNFRKENDKAVESFNRCVKLNPPTEIWLIPHSYFELGKIYYRSGNRETAGKMFDKIYDYKDYDFSNFLEMRVRNFLDK
jgi:tetratricopeptide (TPR) repeat protein